MHGVVWVSSPAELAWAKAYVDGTRSPLGRPDRDGASAPPRSGGRWRGSPGGRTEVERRRWCFSRTAQSSPDSSGSKKSPSLTCQGSGMSVPLFVELSLYASEKLFYVLCKSERPLLGAGLGEDSLARRSDAFKPASPLRVHRLLVCPASPQPNLRARAVEPRRRRQLK